MDGGRSRFRRAACGAVMALALFLGTVACGEQASSPEVATTSDAPPETSGETDAMRAAQATVRAFFAVKGRAADPVSVKIDEQAVYLTARDVHPTAAYETGMNDRPSAITDQEVTVELSDERQIGDAIEIDFEFESTGVSYPIIGNRLQLDEGTLQESHWEGTATLENRDGEWLIDDLTVDSFGGETS